jgi:hypothetical protein
MNDREMLSTKMRRTTSWKHIAARDATIPDMPHVGSMLFTRTWYNERDARVIVGEFDQDKGFFAARMYHAEKGLSYGVRDQEVAGAYVMSQVLEWIGES